MATYERVTLPSQFITPPPSTSNCIQNNDSDSGSSSGGMKAHETSDDSSTSSHQTPPEYPSPPPPSNSPPESMASLQAESPIGDGDTSHDTGGSERSTECTSSEESAGFEKNSAVEMWVAGYGYHEVPNAGPIPNHPHANLFVHVPEGEILQFHRKDDNEMFGSLAGPGTVRMVGDRGMFNQPLAINVPPGQQCHQYIDEEVPRVVDGRQLANAMGGAAGAGPGPSHRGSGNHRGGNRGRDGNQRGNGHNYRNGQGHDAHRNHRPNNRDNNRENRRYHGRGARDYQGPNRADHVNNVNHLNHVPEVAAVPVANMSVPVEQNPQFLVNHQPNMEMVNMIPQIPPVGQPSLLGEPTGPPMADLTLGIQAPLPQQQQPYQPPGMMIPHAPEVQMQEMPMAVMQPMMNGAGMMHDAMMPGPSMGVAPQMYGIPPAGMMMVASKHTYNNNRWIPYQTEEENHNLVDVLSTALQQPTVGNVFPTEVEFMWMPIKIESHRFRNGEALFQKTEPEDISYHASVFDYDGVNINSYVMEVTNNEDEKARIPFRANALRPNTAYMFTIKACVSARQLQGEQTEAIGFRTAPGRPDAPTKVDIINRGTQFISLAWQPSVNNGAFVSMYHVYVQENEIDNGRMLQTSETKVEIQNLMPQTCYKITVNAVNALGESLTGCYLEAWTKANAPPFPPSNITLFVPSHRSIRVNWDINPNCHFWIEIYNTATSVGGFVREKFAGSNTIIGDLEPDTEYKLRIIARNEFGEGPSDWYLARTQKFRRMDNPQRSRNYIDEAKNQRQNIPPNYDRPPSTPLFVRFVDNCPEMAWKSYGPGQREHTYVVEGSTFEMPEKFNQLYRGPATSLIVVDDTVHFMRLYIIHKKGQKSQTTEKVIVPRDYTKYRPERIGSVKISSKNADTLVISWNALDREKSKLPETAKVRYFVRRSDLSDNPLVSVGGETSCVYNNIPGETTISVQVRAVVTFHGEMIHGDWSTPVSYTVPRGLPLPVVNVRFDSSTSLLRWDCFDQSKDLQFTIEIIQLPIRRNFMKMTTKSRNIIMDCVQPGERYMASIYSATSVGCTPKRTCLEFDVPAIPPTAPTEISVPFMQTEKCTVTWKPAEPNGSPITGYLVQIVQDEDIVSESFTDNNHDEEFFRLTMKHLQPNTDYTARVSAKNSIGYGDPIEVAFTTQPLPPVIPTVQCDSDSSTLKLHWEHDPTNSAVNYKIMRINSHGQQMSLYEGENNLVKVKNLIENTEYAFKMRVTDKTTGASVWSQAFSFFTTIAPPPPVKKTPTCSLVPGESYLYNIEWKDCLPASSPYQQFYRIQIVDATIQGAKWQTAYEGKKPKFQLNTEQFPGALHVRVLCVREEEDGELKGVPSPVGYIGNIPPPANPVQEDSNQEKTTFQKILAGAGSPITIAVIIFTFIVVFISFSEAFFDWISGTPVNTNETGAPSQPAPPSTQPPQ